MSRDVAGLVKGVVEVAKWIGQGIKGWFKRKDKRKP